MKGKDEGGGMKGKDEGGGMKDEGQAAAEFTGSQ